MSYTTRTEQWIEEETTSTLRRKMDSDILSSTDIVMAYMERIAAYDREGAKINSILEMNPDALEIAHALDLERTQKGPRSVLHGVPVLVKDNIDTRDKMHTSAGSLAMADSFAPEDSFVAKKLREQGAVILGKSNMTEWANFMTQGMPNGYSSRGGQVLNPYGPGRFDVGGSSSGSGAAIAASFAAVAVGTETSGSILSPGAANALVGIKPTVGLVPRTGIIPISHVQDTAGPLARTVTDAAILLSCIAGCDENDPVSLVGPQKPIDYTKYLDTKGLKGVRIGCARVGLEKFPDDRTRIFELSVKALEDAGAIITDISAPERPHWRALALIHEFKVDLNAYLRRLPPNASVRSLEEVIRFNAHNPATCLKYGQSVLAEAFATDGTLRDPAYIRSRLYDLRSSREEGIDRLLHENQVDILLFPELLGAGLAARAGYPSITVPAGFDRDGRPVGIMFAGAAFCEHLLITAAYAFEQATEARKPPLALGGCAS